jgi:hypothetical protein
VDLGHLHLALSKWFLPRAIGLSDKSFTGGIDLTDTELKSFGISGGLISKFTDEDASLVETTEELNAGV